MAATETPLMRQYLEIKSRYSDALLLFRMGDFYELFFEDAVIAAGILEIALTSRNRNDPEPIPMCGVPHHAADAYIPRLLAAGRKVALCEQLEDPSAAKGIVRRDVVRVISPGLQLDSERLESRANNFIHAAHRLAIDGPIFWATADFTTGDFHFGQFSTRAEWVAYLRAQSIAEVLTPESELGGELLAAVRAELPRTYSQSVAPFFFDETLAREALKRQFCVQSISALHPQLAAHACASGAAGALLKNFETTQKSSRVPGLHRIDAWSSEHTMDLDLSVIESLELLPARHRASTRDLSLLSFLDRTRTAMGARLLRAWVLRPPASFEVSLHRQKQVTFLTGVAATLGPALSRVYDLERLLGRLCAIPAGSANARDLAALAQSVFESRELARTLSSLPAEESRSLAKTLSEALTPELLSLVETLQGALADEPPLSTREGGMFRKGFRAELDEWIDLCDHGTQWLADFESRERSATGIQNLKVRFNRVFGYYIEITKSNLASVPNHYVRKQTTATGERFLTEELKTFEEKVLSAERKRNELEASVFREFCERVSGLAVELSSLARAVAQLDALCALARVSTEEAGYVVPVLTKELGLEIVHGRHPTLENALRQTPNHAYVPNTTRFTAEKPFLLITGPNMGGKSTVMRQTALIVLMAQLGSYVPAESATIGIADRIYTRIGASDNTAEGASTFMVEMSEMSFLIRSATQRSLVLIDEIGRGTSTYDGLSLAWSLARDLAERVGCRTMFATHYHELTQLADQTQRITNLRVAVEVGSEESAAIRFLYRLEEGVAERSYGISVARLAGLPRNLLEEASAVLAALEKQGKTGRERLAGLAQLKLNLEAARKTPEPARSELEAWLTRLDLTRTTPLEAFEQLAKWREKISRTPLQ